MPEQLHASFLRETHLPFEEFHVPSLNALLAMLEEIKPKESKVEVSPIDDTQHIPCMRPLTHIMVLNKSEEKETPKIHAMYQYCQICRLAIRIL